MTRDEARVLAHKLLGKWANCNTHDEEEGDHTQVCDTVTDNILRFDVRAAVVD